MAANWIQVEKSTPDKPEIYAMAARLKIDPDAVLGKVFRVWAWFDEHTTDGHAKCVTFVTLVSQLGRITGCPDFAIAMREVGWLSEDGDGVRMPNFDRHNGESAKKRILAAERKRKQRLKEGMEVTEKSRTEGDEHVTRGRGKGKDKKEPPDGGSKEVRATRLPNDWTLPPDWSEWALQEGYAAEAVARQAAIFHDYWIAKAGSGGCKLNWFATWRNWMRKTPKGGTHDQTQTQSGPGPRRTAPSAIDRVREANRGPEPGPSGPRVVDGERVE